MDVDNENETIIITEEEAGERLDKILAQRFQNTQSRSYFAMLIEEHQVLLNGFIVKKRIQPKAGDEVQINWILTPEIGLHPENIPLDILYEDDQIIAVNKPAGMVVHPAIGNWSGTFANALLYHCQSLPDQTSLRPGIVHRLDKDTSGVIIAAKTATAQQKLVEKFAARQVQKEYLAICIGNPGNVEIINHIGRHPVDRKRMAVVETGGKAAHTICQTIACDGKFSVVRITLATGRTHQIRVHLKHQKTPILGDNIYGNSVVNAKHHVTRQLLHAQSLRLLHPISQLPLVIEAPLPEDIKFWVDKI